MEDEPDAGTDAMRTHTHISLLAHLFGNVRAMGLSILPKGGAGGGLKGQRRHEDLPPALRGLETFQCCFSIHKKTFIETKILLALSKTAGFRCLVQRGNLKALLRATCKA